MVNPFFAPGSEMWNRFIWDLPLAEGIRVSNFPGGPLFSRDELMPTAKILPYSYRTLMEELLEAAREETPDLEDMLPAPRARYDAMVRALEAGDVEEDGFRNHVTAFVRLVERHYGWQKGLPVTLIGPVGEVYHKAVAQLQKDGRYPVLKRRPLNLIAVSPPCGTPYYPRRRINGRARW